MTVGELKELLDKIPDEKLLFLRAERGAFRDVTSVCMKMIHSQEYIGRSELAQKLRDKPLPDVEWKDGYAKIIFID